MEIEEGSMITIHERTSYDCCNAEFEDKQSKIRLHYHKILGEGTNIRQIYLVGTAGVVVDMNLVPPHARRECDEWQ